MSLPRSIRHASSAADVIGESLSLEAALQLAVAMTMTRPQLCAIAGLLVVILLFGFYRAVVKNGERRPCARGKPAQRGSVCSSPTT